MMIRNFIVIPILINKKPFMNEMLKTRHLNIYTLQTNLVFVKMWYEVQE